MNKATLIGRFAADPELKTTGSGVAVTSFTLAVDRPYSKGEKQTDWLDIVAWRSTAEHICKHFRKGEAIVIDGTIQTRNWEDKNGQKRKAVEIVAEKVEFVPRNKNEKAGNDEFVPRIQYDDFVPVDEEDLPF